MAYVDPQSCCDMNVPQIAARMISGNSARSEDFRRKSEQIHDRQHRRQQKQQRPKRQQAVAALVGIVINHQRSQREKKRRGQQRESRNSRPAKSLRRKAQKHQSNNDARQRPQKCRVVKDREHFTQSRQTPLAGELDRPVQVVAEANGPMQRERSGDQRRACSRQNCEQRSCPRRTIRILPAPHPPKDKHDHNRADCRRQKRQAHILLEEKRNANHHARREAVAHAAFCVSPLQEPQRNQNPECAVAVVLGNGNDAVDAEKDQRRGDEQCHGPVHAAPAQRSSSAPTQSSKREPPCDDRPQRRPPPRHKAHDEKIRGP